jgi:hypothetical protein
LNDAVVIRIHPAPEDQTRRRHNCWKVMRARSLLVEVRYLKRKTSQRLVSSAGQAAY